MQKLIIALCMCGAVTVGSPSVALADYKDGVTAYQRGDYVTAFKEMSALAKQGHAKAQYTLGVMYDNGEGVAEDNDEAFKWYRKAAEQGNVDATNAIPKLIRQMIEEFTATHPGQDNLIELYAEDLSYGKSVLGYMGYELGVAAYKRGDYAIALKEFKPLAEQGNAKAQFLMSVMYSGGEGVPQNYAEAVKWLRLAAEQAFDRAQFLLGMMHAEGKGVPQNYAEAVKWFRLAANKGHASAQYSLGVAYKKGQGVLQDIAESVKWYRKAAEQNDVKAQSQVGTLLLVMYAAKGQDVPLPVEAIKWFRRAAENGDAGSQVILGGIYKTGALVIKDYVQAYMWFNIAAGNGHANGRKGRDILEKRMTATDISRAQKLAKEWMKKNRKERGQTP